MADSKDSTSWDKRVDKARRIAAANIRRIESGQTYRSGKQSKREKPSSSTDGKRRG